MTRAGGGGRNRCCAALLLLAQIAASGAAAEVIDLSGEHGYDPVVLRDLGPGSVIDARSAMFRPANSRNTNPSAEAGCEIGPLPVNAYPLRIYRAPAALLIGGTFDGEVPQASDWEHSYCNSAAIAIFDSPRMIVERARVRRAWDGARFSGASDFLVLGRSWFSEIRDDCLENDFLNDGLVEDVLFDGCFSGISMRQLPSRAADGSARTLTLLGALIRVTSYPYRGEMRTGPPIKAGAASPRLRVIDSVFAMEGNAIVSRSQLAAGWERISDCRGNLFLWMSDRPWPPGFKRPPSCFRFVQGPEARALWREVRDNWIGCHPNMRRFEDDPAPETAECDALSYGRQY
ncbi:hypothetical protein [Amaricoccus solimangrovi]|uniref:DUF1036 domain-containing protein n=1 Tax=Amaricoccus solimangrovi TaxID=2589815 RepID=A0A501WID2_9RHOB|nr:hypothetical protein [Amaricoccus solimangrovi]TPE49138.1 hypothetical protein FJM51_15820 [Amaricoccus solimangrovi]